MLNNFSKDDLPKIPEGPDNRKYNQSIKNQKKIRLSFSPINLIKLPSIFFLCMVGEAVWKFSENIITGQGDNTGVLVLGSTWLAMAVMFAILPNKLHNGEIRFTDNWILPSVIILIFAIIIGLQILDRLLALHLFIRS